MQRASARVSEEVSHLHPSSLARIGPGHASHNISHQGRAYTLWGAARRGRGQISLEHNPRNWQTGQTKELHLQASSLQGGHLKRNAALTVFPENAPPGRHHVRGALSFLRPALVEALVERESLLNL